MDKGLMTGAVFIDLSKAFNTLDHACLLSKLSIYGIKEREMSWLSSYFFDKLMEKTLKCSVQSLLGSSGLRNIFRRALRYAEITH